MAYSAGLDWPAYLNGLQDDKARSLATWLASEGLGVSEFMEIVDRAYATVPNHWVGRPRAFMTLLGRPAADAYAGRKRRFAGLMAALEEALVSGALLGEVASQELRPSTWPSEKERRAPDLLRALERARRDQE